MLQNFTHHDAGVIHIPFPKIQEVDFQDFGSTFLSHFEMPNNIPR